LTAIGMTRWHTRLIGVEVQPVQSEAVCGLGTEQRELVSKSGGTICAAQQVLDASL